MLLLRLEKVSLSYGSRVLLDQVSMQLEQGEKVALIGRNGEGKSSLLRLLRGEAEPDQGTIWTRTGTRVAFLAQESRVSEPVSVEQWVAAGLTGAAPDDHRVATVLSRLKLDPQARLDELSGGTRRRALLAQALVCDPQILLLDEPTNHLDIDTIEWLERTLLEFRGAALFVSHDRTFIDRVGQRIVELDRGSLTSFDGRYDAYLRAKTAQLAVEAEHRALFDKKLAQEEAWIRQGVEARRTLYALRSERRARRERTGSVQLESAAVAESGTLVFQTDHLRAVFGERVVIDDLSMRIMRGDRIGLIGPNGIGKSTLIRALLGEIEPTAGTVRRGSRLEIAYYDQERLQLNLDASVMENVSGRNDQVIVNGQARHVAGYLRDFLFRPEQLNTPARALSGGERNRLLLARLFTRPANLLVMDEPTNDLDIDTLQQLEDLLDSWAGTMVVVSHDRYLVERVCDTVVALFGDGRITHLPGGIDEYLKQLDRQIMPAPAAGPSVISGAAEQRNARKTLARRLETLNTRVAKLHEEMAGTGTDPNRLTELDAELRAVLGEQEELEEQWLAAAELAG
jgi:ATP-binding cassette subfamily F protein uup